MNITPELLETSSKLAISDTKLRLALKTLELLGSGEDIDIKKAVEEINKIGEK